MTNLLERGAELELLDAAVAGEAHRRPSVVVLEGGPGLGKTALLEHAGELGRRRGYEVLRGRAGVLEGSFGWGVARQLFESRVVRAAAAERRALLRKPASAEFDSDHGLYWLARNLAERRPVAILIDDAQWCDHASLRWLLYLARRLDEQPIVVVIAVRESEAGGRRRLLDAIGALPIAATCRLQALGPGAVRTVLARSFGGPVSAAFAEACWRWTGGNPLFALELAGTLAAEGVVPGPDSIDQVTRFSPPQCVSRLLLLRLARVSAHAAELARAVAVLGAHAQLSLAAAMAGLSERAAVAALDRLIQAGVLDTEPRLEFVQPLFGRVIYDDLPPARRASDHKRAAKLLAESGHRPEWLAPHLLASMPAGDPWVTAQLMAAADHELRDGVPAAAVCLLRRALEEPAGAEEAAILPVLARAESLAGDPAAVDTLTRALPACADPGERASLALLLGRLELRGARPGAAVRALRAEADALGWGDPDRRLALEALLMTAARFDVGAAALISDRQALVRAHQNRSASAPRLLDGQRSWTLAVSGTRARGAIELARRALADARLLERAPEEWLGPIHALTLADELDEADHWWGLALAHADRSGSVPARAVAWCYRSITARLRGRPDEAVALALGALEASGDALLLVRGLASVNLALARLDGGEGDPLASLQDGLGRLKRLPRAWGAEAAFAAGRAMLADGRAGDAAELLVRSGRWALEVGIVNPAALPWRSEAALALRAAGDTAEAARLSSQELQLAHRFGARRPIGAALRAAGLIAGGDEGLELLEQSVGVLARSPARLEHARSLVELGAALRRCKRRTDARLPLQQAISLADACHGRPLADRARLELAAVSGRARNVFRTGSDSLTPSERRVCDLAAAGRSNPEIASSLFVSRATVESHLHNAYRKLQIESRAELELALAA